eukprot:TCONS_00053240-protein
MKITLLILLVCILQLARGQEEDVLTRFNKVLDDIRTLEQSGYTAIRDMSQEINKVKSTVGTSYWKGSKKLLTNIYSKIGKDSNTFQNLIRARTNFRTNQTLLDAIDELATSYSSNHLSESEDKFQDFLKFHETEGGKLLELADAAEDTLADLVKKHQEIKDLKEEVEEIIIEDPEVKKLKETLYLITRQIQNMQFNEEEKTRSDGNSGIKQIRTRAIGGKTYHSSSHTGRSFAAIHDHSNNKKICGMGEFIGVLNGVEFRTRHNDFALRSAAYNDDRYEATKELEFPNVPQAVLNKESVEDQIKEMVEWFRAFKNQDHSKRDYRRFFKPVLCYLEGAWTRPKDNSGDIDEPFESDRHSIDAKSWFELQEKIRFTSYSGTKDLLENLAWLPTSIMGFDENKKPKLAQWNYRILCHPLSKDLPTSYLKPILDPHSQKMNEWDDVKLLTSRAIRFNMEGVDKDGRWRENPQSYTLVDELMEEIPGKNNYGAQLDAAGFDSTIFSAHPDKKNEPLNGAYYHRPYRLGAKDAMGTDSTMRGYSDRVYMAMTDQGRIAGQTYIDEDDNEVETKVSYAIPMEIIYLTPLANWNPYNIQYEDDQKIEGSGSKNNPYNRSNGKNFFHTPASFFTGVAESDAADTSKNGGVWIKNDTGVAVNTQASGVRIVFPKIADIEGIIRQRYPIMPIYGEGNTIWKRLNAFEDSLDGYETKLTSNDVFFQMGVSHAVSTGDSEKDITEHTHMIQMSLKKFKAMRSDKTLRHTVTSTKAVRHTHDLVLYVDENDNLAIEECDAKTKSDDNLICFDRHFTTLSRQN